MNNLRKIFCAVLVFAILCSALAFVINAETTEFTPLRRFEEGNVPNNTKSLAEGNLYNDFSTWGAQDAYKNTLQPYIVYDNGSEDGYYLARVESDGKDVIGAGSDTHNHINLYMNGNPAINPGDVIVYETDMYFESDIISGLYFGLNIRNDSGAVKTAMDYDVAPKLPIGKWFRLTMIADFDTNMAYYYADGELISTRDKLVRGDTDPETTTYALHTLRWQFYQATIKHGQSIAFDNVYVNIYKTADIGTYVPGDETLEGFEKATPYSLREVVPIAKIDGEPYYTANEIKEKLSTSLKPVMIEILRDSNAALSIACDATIQTNGIEILIDTPEGSQMTGPDENGFIEVDVPYTPAYTVESDGFAASFIKNNGDKSINILKGVYGSVDYFASDSKITPYAGGDSYLKVTPVKDTAIGGDVEEVRIYYTDRYYLKMNDFYVIDFDVATESEFADMVLIPVLGHETSDSKVKVRLDGETIRFKDFIDPSNEWAHVTAIGDIANNKMYIFVNDVLVNDNYGMAYNAEVAEANNMDLTEPFENEYSAGPLNFVELRLGFTGADSVISTTDTTLLKNLAVRRFAGSENEDIATAVEGKSLTKWANNKNTTKGEKLPNIIVVDGVGYGNVVLANEVISKDNGTTKEISFRADFETTIHIAGAAILETNGLGNYVIDGEDQGPVYFADEYGLPAMIAASTSISEKDGKIYISQVTIENALETCQAVYWALDENFDPYLTIYYPAGTEIRYMQHPDFDLDINNIVIDGVPYDFGGWIDANDGSIVEELGIAKAGADASYYPMLKEKEITATLTGAMYNLSLYTDYAINLFVPADIYVGEATKTVTAGGIKYVVLTKEVAATEIGKAVEFEVTFTEGGREFTQTVAVSVIEYAEAVMASNYSKMLKRTIMAALNYSETAIEELVDPAGNAAIKAILNNAAYSEYLPAGMTEATATETTVSTYVFDATADHAPMDKETKADGDTENVGTNGYFTIHYSANSKFDSSNKTFEDGYSATQRFSTGGKTAMGDTIKNAIEFTTQGPATVTVWWVCAGDGDRELDLYDAKGNIVKSTAIDPVKNSLYISTLDIAEAGKYYLGSINNNYYFKVQVTETGATTETPDAPEFLTGSTIHIDSTPDFVFVLADNYVGKITFTYTGVDGVVTVTKDVDATQNKYVVLDNVKVYDMTATISITAEGNISGTAEYSLENYIAANSNIKTAEALYVYATVAKAYKLACLAVKG